MNIKNPVPLDMIGSKHKIILLITGIIAASRDFIIYSLSTRNYNFNILRFNFGRAGVHALLEFFLTFVFFISLAYLLKLLVKRGDERENSDLIINRDIFYIAQLSILRDVMTLAFVGIRALSKPIFLTTNEPRSYGYYEPATIYWNLFSLSVFLTIIYLSKYVMERLKDTYRDFNQLILASGFISTIIYSIAWLSVWLIRLLISLPFGYEFYS